MAAPRVLSAHRMVAVAGCGEVCWVLMFVIAGGDICCLAILSFFGRGWGADFYQWAQIWRGMCQLWVAETALVRMVSHI